MHNLKLPAIIVAALSVSIFIPSFAIADAIVRSRAMFADTIAEFYIERDRVRLELEIGTNDVSAFRNLLPDSLYQQLGYGDATLKERLALFVSEDMPVGADGQRLPARVTHIGPGTRPLRDDITGEELPTPEDEAIVVVLATIEYLFRGEPDSITLIGPSKAGSANIGFILYHEGVAVNDYRYLSASQTAQLDWQDPWYTAFPDRGMRRQYYSPMTGFIYVEPYEVRKEIIVRPADIQRYVDLGLEGETTILAERHAEIKTKIVDFLDDHFAVKIDGQPVRGTVDRVNFLKRTLRASVVVDDQDLALLPATVGVIYVFPTDGLPNNVEMEWDLFTEKTPTIPASTVDQAGPLPTILEPDFNVLRWENFLKFPELPTLVDIEQPPGTLYRLAGSAQWLFGIVSFVLLALMLRALKTNRSLVPRLAMLFLPALGLSVFMVYQHRQVQLNDERLAQLVGNLLHNVYRAFDYRGEEVIYDVLEKSVSGDLLIEIYLETQQSLELENQGGARVKVKSIAVNDVALSRRDGNNLTIRSNWSVLGSVGHWGHIHERANGYNANLEISEVDGTWKLTGLEILEEKRL